MLPSLIRRCTQSIYKPVAYSQRSGRRLKERMAAAAEKKAKAGGAPGKLVLKTAKGTRDYTPKEMALRKKVLGTITEVFEQFDAESIDTPIFEIREILMGKYGEEGGKLVYDLADQGGELLSMRYDLTVPFARYCAMNKVNAIKRYHIGKVYRRDQPVMTRGRYREFYQCDYDIAGQYDSMLPESECLLIADKILKRLDVGEFHIKINHRFILEAMVSTIGAGDQIKTICSSVDKLDKQPWNEIEEELVETKNISREAAQKLGNFVRFRELNPDLNNQELLSELRSVPELASNEKISEKINKGINELEELFKLCKDVNVTSVRFDPSLARGLDYYTGVIYEAVIPKALEGVAAEKGEKGEALPAGVGSVAAGGRYDGLVASFSPKSKVPCCGISFGIERLFAIKDAQSQAIRTNDTEVIVIAAQKGLVTQRRQLADMLRNNKFKVAEFLKNNPKFLNQMQYAEEREIPFAVIIGESELAAGVVKLKNVVSKEEKEVPMSDIPIVLRSELSSSS